MGGQSRRTSLFCANAGAQIHRRLDERLDGLARDHLGRPAERRPLPTAGGLGCPSTFELDDNLTARSTARTGRGPVRVNPKIDAVAVALLRLAFDLDGSYR
jgi:hypothetical protein